MAWHEQQGDFAEALRDPNRPPPRFVSIVRGANASERFNIYRNNVATSLIDALAATFPVVAELVGEAFFKAMARAYAHQNPPQSPVLLAYGSGFAEFVDSFVPGNDLPYLADVARFEWLWSEAYHAGDAIAVSIDELEALGGEKLGEAVFEIHPTLRVFRSEWPVISIWHAHQGDGDAREGLAQIEMAAECGVIVRAELSVDVRRVPIEAFDAIETLREGQSLEMAAEALGAARNPDRFGALVRFLFDTGSVVGVTPARDIDQHATTGKRG